MELGSRSIFFACIFFLLKASLIGMVLSAVGGPLKLQYMRKLRFQLLLIDSWPARELGESARSLLLRNNKILFSLWLSTLVLQFLFIYNNKDKVSFFELGHSYITMLITTVDVQRITLMWTKSYKEVTKEFVDKIHLFHHRNSSEYAMQTYRLVNKICTIFTYYLYFLAVIAMFFFNVAPMVINYKSGMYNKIKPENGTYVHSVYFQLPFDYTTNTYGYIGIFIMNFMFSYDAGCCFCMFDLYLMIIVFNVWGHMRILHHNLTHFPRPSEMRNCSNQARATSSDALDWYTDKENRKVMRMLKQLINHHRLIMEFNRKASSAFGLTLAVYFTFHQVCGCILLLECSTLSTDALMKYGGMTVVVFQQLMQISVVFEFVGSKNDTLKDSVYSLPWERMNVSNRKLVLFFLSNAQKSISIKAMGLVPIGVQTMAGILKTSVTYFIMLRTIA